MKNLKIIMAMAALASTIISCNSKKNKINAGFEDHHTAQNSLDWQGTYSGILPCADCSGIETALILNADNTFVLTSLYLGKGDVGTDTLKGKFQWNGNSIHLMGIKKGEAPTVYKVEENQIR
ncbi:MAG TPA: copper resistance protein NlpE N-terminal domain-containing protein, partial [Arenibacter sp.]|nr:copper resistance protein NlpE N-terminal domain-containing protein [Arenibacter sp.]